MQRATASIALLLGLCPLAVLANDAAAAVGVGGIQLRSERRIAMRSERLHVSVREVRVEYEFVNESAEDVETEVAFPIPELKFSLNAHSDRFDTFKAWVDEREVTVTTEVRAFVGERDVTRRLTSLGIDAASFGNHGLGDSAAQLPTLPDTTLISLCREGIVRSALRPGACDLPALSRHAGGYEYPAWSVRVTKHWRQRFPAGRTVRIRHEYSPAAGYENRLVGLDGACISSSDRARLLTLGGSSFWVKYILTTANTWKTPIRDFELRVEHDESDVVGVCWDGSVERANASTLRASVRDFIPKQELTVHWYVPSAEPPSRPSQP